MRVRRVHIYCLRYLSSILEKEMASSVDGSCLRSASNAFLFAKSQGFASIAAFTIFKLAFAS